MTTHSTGFTLLEMLIAMALIAILICIAYPSYRHHLQHARHNEAVITLQGIASEMENYFGEYGKYPNSMQAFSKLTNDVKGYRFALITPDDTSYVIKAIPKGEQTACKTIRFDSAGRWKNKAC